MKNMREILAEKVDEVPTEVFKIVKRKQSTISGMSTVHISKQPEEVRNFVAPLKHYTFKEVFGVEPKKGEEFNQDFTAKGLPVWFIIDDVFGKSVLVDTEGYDYPRYLAVVKL